MNALQTLPQTSTPPPPHIPEGFFWEAFVILGVLAFVLLVGWCRGSGPSVPEDGGIDAGVDGVASKS